MRTGSADVTSAAYGSYMGHRGIEGSVLDRCRGAFAGAPRFEGLRSFLRLLPICLLASTSGACSINLPMTSLVPEAEPETTASIIPNSSMLSPGLSPSDWDLASTALDKALDPQLAGAATKWSNPDTGTRGAFAAAGPAYVREDRVCRAFKAAVSMGGPEKLLIGTACRVGAGAWRLQKVKPLTDGA
jgi:surface antigen